MNMTVTSNIDIARHLNNIQDDTFWTFAASEWHKLITPFKPKQTGTLSESVNISPKSINYTEPYDNRIYNGVGMNFTIDGQGSHSQASAKWDKAAMPTQERPLIASMQAYIDSGRLEL